jgi:uncharacterized phiE125 gp8 family phage protein
MKFTVITPPTLEPVTLAEFKDAARIDVTDADGLLAGYLITARRWAEDLCGLALMTQTLDAYFDCFERYLTIPRGQVQSVTSVSYIDTAGATQTVSSTYYALDNRSRPNVVELLPRYTWPQADNRLNAITVRYIAGVSAMGDVPEEIRTAIMLHARYLYDGNDPDRVAAERLISSKRVWF